MFPQSRHSRPTARTSQCPGPGKIFDHGEKYLVHTVRPGSSDLIITETVDCVDSPTLTCDQGGVLRWRGVTTVSSGDKKVPVERFSRCEPWHELVHSAEVCWNESEAVTSD